MLIWMQGGTKMESNKKMNLSWGIIILILIFFWPAGLVLIYLKSKESIKNKISFSGKIKIGIGLFSIFIGLVGFSVEVEERSEDFMLGMVLVAFFLGIGAFLLKKGIDNIKEGKIYDKIAYMINFRKIESVQKIADNLQISLDKTMYYVSKTIELGLCDEDIDYRDEKIINRKFAKEKAEKEKKRRVVKCESCGGINHIYEDESATCEYCGMDVSLNK